MSQRLILKISKNTSCFQNHKFPRFLIPEIFEAKFDNLKRLIFFAKFQILSKFRKTDIRYILSSRTGHFYGHALELLLMRGTYYFSFVRKRLSFILFQAHQLEIVYRDKSTVLYKVFGYVCLFLNLA